MSAKLTTDKYKLINSLDWPRWWIDPMGFHKVFKEGTLPAGPHRPVGTAHIAQRVSVWGDDLLVIQRSGPLPRPQRNARRGRLHEQGPVFAVCAQLNGRAPLGSVTWVTWVMWHFWLWVTHSDHENVSRSLWEGPSRRRMVQEVSVCGRVGVFACCCCFIS